MGVGVKGLCHPALESDIAPLPPPAIWEPLERRREEEPRTSKVFPGWKLHPRTEGAAPAGHFHGNQPASLLGLTRGQQAWEPWPL